MFRGDDRESDCRRRGWNTASLPITRLEALELVMAFDLIKHRKVVDLPFSLIETLSIDQTTSTFCTVCIV